VDNTADMTLISRGGQPGVGTPVTNSRAYGIYTTAGDATNAGRLVVQTHGGSSSSGHSVEATAYGLSFWGAQLTNSGDITTQAWGGSSTGGSPSTSGIAVGIQSQGNLVNTGTIHAQAVAGRLRASASHPWVSDGTKAYGIEMMGNGTLDSRGLITVDAQPYPGLSGGSHNAYQVRVTTGTTTILGYAMALGTQAGFDQAYGGTINTNTGASAIFSNAVLYLSISPNFSGQSEYTIPTLVDGASVSDQFLSLAPLPADYQAALVNGNGATPQKIQISYNPTFSPVLVSTQVQNEFNSQGHSMVGNTVLNSILPDIIPLERAGFSTADYLASPQGLLNNLGSTTRPLRSIQGRTTAFVSPVLLASERDHPTQGYDAQHHGLLAGVTRKTDNGIFWGAHAGTGRVSVDYTGTGYEQRSEDMDSYWAGMHLLWMGDSDWLFSAMGSGYYARARYRDDSPANPESGAYESHALRLDVSLGHLIRLGRHTWLPQMGVSGLWNHRNAFQTKNLLYPDVSHGAMDDYQIMGRVGMRWFGRFDLGRDWRFFPGAGIEIRQLFTDDKLSQTQTVGSLSKTVDHGLESLMVSPRIGLGLFRDDLSFSAGYSGGYADDTRQYLFWFQAGYSF
ncbi:MAG: autotransporter outer membrane beta-barrel domain-containing protein, partial [Desulfobacterales bacterium]|nr:autotransporter outer membrane beta-barrel domain-containing protein [Desulfobacterales bacterium]